MTDDLERRLRTSTGFTTFTAGDGHPSLKADTDLMVEAADHIDYLQRTIVDAANVLCPAIEGNTEDVEADMDTGYRILRAAVENLADDVD